MYTTQCAHGSRGELLRIASSLPPCWGCVSCFCCCAVYSTPRDLSTSSWFSCLLPEGCWENSRCHCIWHFSRFWEQTWVLGLGGKCFSLLNLAQKGFLCWMKCRLVVLSHEFTWISERASHPELGVSRGGEESVTPWTQAVVSCCWSNTSLDTAVRVL